MKSHSYGITKTTEKIIAILLNWPKCYYIWHELSSTSQNYLKSEISRAIKSELLGKEFKKALAKDILKNGEIAIETEVFKYLKKRVYRNDLRRLLVDLQSALED